VAHKQPTLVRDECQPPAVAEFDGALLHRHPPSGGDRAAALSRCDWFLPMFPVELAKLRRCAIHPGV